MPRRPGTPKTGGRKAGTPNKIKASATELLNEIGFDPLRGMAVLAKDDSVPVAIRSRMLAELAQYVYPKRRSVELSGVDGSAIEIDHGSSALESLEARIDGIAERLGAAAASQSA